MRPCPKKRTPLTFKHLLEGSKETFSQPTTLACMLVSGLVFGIFVAYLGAVQEIFDKIFHQGPLFPMFFAVLALALGGASFFNSRLVLALGMRRLILSAFLGMAVVSNLFAGYLENFQQGTPPLWLFMAYMI